MKSVLAVFLLAFVVVALAWALLKPAETAVVEEMATEPVEQVAAAEPDTAPVEAISNGVVAYYLHPESRCATCMKIEELSRMAIKDGFATALEEGRLQWLALNVDQPANKHFMDDFDLHTTSLVLARRKDGETVEFKNCTKVWELVHSPMKFNSYVESETAKFLGDA